MALEKRGSTWHCHFVVDGQRFRQLLKTKDWRVAQAKERELVAQARQGKLAAAKNTFARMPFSEAAAQFLEDRIPHLAPRSVQTERERVKPINALFGQTTVLQRVFCNISGRGSKLASRTRQ